MTFSSTSGTFSAAGQPCPRLLRSYATRRVPLHSLHQLARASSALLADALLHRAPRRLQMNLCESCTPDFSPLRFNPCHFVCPRLPSSPPPPPSSAYLAYLFSTLRFFFALSPPPPSFMARSFPQSGTNWAFRDVVSSAWFVFHARGFSSLAN